MDLFTNKRIITDYRNNQANSPSYRWIQVYHDGHFVVMLKYYAGGNLDNQTFNVQHFPLSFPKAYVFFQNINGEVVSYEYNGDVEIERKTENNVREDIIVNIDEIKRNIINYIHEVL